jgi:predicted DNA binding protein
MPRAQVRNGQIKIGFVGEAKEIRRLFRRLKQSGIAYRIDALIDAKFAPDYPLSVLTEKQRRILLFAYEHGYYDVPRKKTSEDLSLMLALDKSTIVEHLRKAEKRLLAHIITNK